MNYVHVITASGLPYQVTPYRHVHGASDTTTTELQIVLSGTHGIVHPWVAARGIPVDELRKLDLSLLDALRERLAENVKVGAGQKYQFRLG